MGWMKEILEFVRRHPGRKAPEIKGALGIKRMRKSYFKELEDAGLIVWRDGWYPKEAER